MGYRSLDWGCTVLTVTTGEVTTLEHEVGDDTVEGRALVAETVFTSGELTEVLRGPRDNIVEELEDDATSGLVVDGDVELKIKHKVDACTSII